MDRNGNLRSRTNAALEQGGGDTERLATEWAMPFIPEDGSNSPTDVPFTTARRPQRPVSGCVSWFGRLLMLFGLVVLLSGVYGGFSMMTREASRTLKPQTYQVSGAPTVHIENSIGNVEVIAGTRSEVEVVARVEVRHISQGLADQAVDDYELDVSQPEPGTITIRAGERNPFADGDFFAGWFARRSVNLVVTVPANSNLEFDVAAGHMNIDGITGRMNAQVNAGSLSMDNVKLGDGSQFKVNAGSLSFDGELLPDASISVEVNAGSADFQLPRTTAARLEATASAGGVRTSGWPTGDFSRVQDNDNTSISGYLTDDKNARSLILVTVHAGSVQIDGRTERTVESAPPAPSAPPASAAPAAPPARPRP